MPKKEAKKDKPEILVLTEPQIEDTFEIIRGFNIPDGDGEKRYEPGIRKPRFVMEKDFEPEVWRAIKAGGALKPVQVPEVREEKE